MLTDIHEADIGMLQLVCKVLPSLPADIHVLPYIECPDAALL